MEACTVREDVLSRLALLAGLTPAEAVYVPATLSVFATSADWQEPRMADQLFRNSELRSYFVQVIRDAKGASR